MMTMPPVISENPVDWVIINMNCSMIPDMGTSAKLDQDLTLDHSVRFLDQD